MTRQFATDQFVGGNQDQVFAKNSGADFDMGWKDPTGGGGEGGHKIHTTGEPAVFATIGGSERHGFYDYNLDDHDSGVTVEVGDYIVSRYGTNSVGEMTGDAYIMTVTALIEDEVEEATFIQVSYDSYILAETGKWINVNCSGITGISGNFVKATDDFVAGENPSVRRSVASESILSRDLNISVGDDNYNFNEIVKNGLWTNLISKYESFESDDGGIVGHHTFELYDVAIQAEIGQHMPDEVGRAEFRVTPAIIGTLDPDNHEYATVATSVNGAAPTFVTGTPFETNVLLEKNAYILRHEYVNSGDSSFSYDRWYLIINDFTYDSISASPSSGDLMKITYSGSVTFSIGEVTT